MPKPYAQIETVRSNVCVVGGGLAGLSAALAAARTGADTVLVHNRPALGGNSSTEIRVPPFGAGCHNPLAVETGLLYELLLEERARCHEPVNYGLVNAQWDLTLYEAVRAQERLTVHFNTNVYDVEMESNRIAAVFGMQMGTEKHLRYEAGCFVDASGDGVVGAAAGVPEKIGPEARSEFGESMAPEQADDWTLGSSLLFRARDVGRPVDFTAPDWAARYDDEAALGSRPHDKQVDCGYWWIEVGFPFHSITGNEEIKDELLRHVLGIWDHLKNHPNHREKTRNLMLDWVGMLPGKRESRRFYGAHVLTQQEIQERCHFADCIGYGGWIIDDHTKGGIHRQGAEPSFDDVSQEQCLVSPYSVPLRSLYCRQPENLFLAGRIMSASRVAFNSLRVQITLAVLGQAAGTAAAHCVAQKKLPTELTPADIHAVQQVLLRDDCYLPNIVNEDPEDLARQASVTASSEAPFPAAADERAGRLLTTATAQCLALPAGRLKSVSAFLSVAAPAALRARLVQADDIWDTRCLTDPARNVAVVNVLGCTVREVPATAGQWIMFDLGVDLPQRGIYWLALEAADGVTWHYSSENLPGLTCASVADGRWCFRHGMFTAWRTLAVTADPAPMVYTADNVVNGAHRPESWPNLWLSDPAQPLPQWIELRWSEDQTIRRIDIRFDTNLSRTYTAMTGFHRSPECVADYEIQVLKDGDWRTVVSATGNYHRRRVHDIEPVRTSRLRLVAKSTNGARSAGVYEIRVY